MAAQRARSHVFESYEHTLLGIGVGLFAALSREAGSELSQLCLRLTGEFLNGLLCLLIGEGHRLAGPMLDYQQFLDFYCVLTSVVPLLHCLLGLR